MNWSSNAASFYSEYRLICSLWRKKMRTRRKRRLQVEGRDGKMTLRRRSETADCVTTKTAAASSSSWWALGRRTWGRTRRTWLESRSPLLRHGLAIPSALVVVLATERQRENLNFGWWWAGSVQTVFRATRKVWKRCINVLWSQVNFHVQIVAVHLKILNLLVGGFK